MVCVEIKNMIEEIFELVLLKISQQFLSNNNIWFLRHIVTVATMNEGAPHVFTPRALSVSLIPGV